jgi:hypothetical protein
MWMLFTALLVAASPPLPPAVRHAVAKAWPTAHIERAEREASAGKVVWEVALKVDGRTFEATFDGAGRVLTEEHVVAPESLPAAARVALKVSAPKGATLERVEQVTEGARVTWEAVFRPARGERLELVIDVEGHVEQHVATE